AAPHVIHAAWQNPDQCFNQGTGAPIKWYVVMPNGEVVLFDSPGYDKFGTRKQPVTKEICEIFHRQLVGDRPHRVTIDPRKIEFFDPITRASRIWYSKSATGFRLYDANGFDPLTAEPLKPVTAEIAEAIRATSENGPGRAPGHASGSTAPTEPSPNPSPSPAVPISSSPDAKASSTAPIIPSPNSSPSSTRLISPSPNSTPSAQGNPDSRPSRSESASALQTNSEHTPASTFEFRVCNRTAAPAAIAVMGREPSAGPDWILKGWMRVEAGQCRAGGKFLKGEFFFAANSPIHQWSASGIAFCVDSGPF